MTHDFQGFAALGDSFTEGMNDRGDDGGFRGWADLVATRLAEVNPRLAYANLAVRGRLFDAVIDDQVPAALRLRPDLVSFVAGGNDALRPGFNPDRIAGRLHEAVRVLTASGATVVLFTSAAVPDRIPGGTLLRNRLASLNAVVRRVADRHSAHLVNLWDDTTFTDTRMWSDDRLHMSGLGHHRVAEHVCRSLDVEPDPAWHTALSPLAQASWLTRRREDMRWARGHLAPWVRRRMAGVSSGDTVTAKRPSLTPLRESGS